MALTQEQLDAVKNKYLDGEGLAHLWEKIKAQSAKIALIGSTGSTWEEILLQESDKKDKKYIEWLLSAEQDVMIEDVSDNNRRYYYVKQEKGDHERLDYIWESYSSSKIYRITVKGDSLALILTKEEFPYEDQDGYAFNTYVAGAYIDDNKNKIHFIDGTYNHSTNNLEVEVNNTGGTLIFNDKVGNKTLTFDVASYVADEVSDATQNLIEIAEGKTKIYVIGEFTSATGQGKAVLNDQFKTNKDDIVLSIRSTTIEGSNTWAGFQDPNGNFVSLEDLKVGDIVLLKESNYPDRWVSYIDESKQAYATATFTSLEVDKVDLNGYVTGTGLTADTIVLGNGNSGVKTSNATIASSITNNQSTWTNIPNIGAIINYVQPKLPTGTNGHILQLSNGVPTWANPSSLSVGSATTADKVANSLTFNNSGAGATSGTTYNGSAAKTISYNTIGAVASSKSVWTSDEPAYQQTQIKNEVIGEPGTPTISLLARWNSQTVNNTLITKYQHTQGIEITKDGIVFTRVSQNRQTTVSSVEQKVQFGSDGMVNIKNNKKYAFIDTSMTLTTGEIDKIIKDLENNS